MDTHAKPVGMQNNNMHGKRGIKGGHEPVIVYIRLTKVNIELVSRITIKSLQETTNQTIDQPSK